MTQPLDHVASPPCLIFCDRVSRLYPDGKVAALTDVNLRIENGEYVSIMGPSGSGKSTLLNVIAGLDRPTSGEIYFDGKPLSNVAYRNRLRREQLGFVFQSFNLLPTLTACENVQVPMFEGPLGATARRRKAIDLLGLVGLGQRLNHLPTQLSGGERQRVGVALRPGQRSDLAPRRRTDRQPRYRQRRRATEAVRYLARRAEDVPDYRHAQPGNRCAGGPTDPYPRRPNRRGPEGRSRLSGKLTMWFSTFVLKNLARRPLRSLLTVVAIAVAIGAVDALVGIATGFERSFLQIYQGASVDLIVTRDRSRQQINSSLDESLGPKIEAIPGVRTTLPGMFDLVSFPEYGLYSVVVQGWPPETPIFDHVTKVEGRKLTRSDRKAVLLGSGLARILDKKIGDHLELMENENFTVVGIYETSSLVENGAAIMPLKELQRIMARPNQVTGISVVLTRPGDPELREEVRAQIKELAPNLQVLSTREQVDSVSELRLAKAMAWLTSTIALLIGSFGMMNTMVMSVHERTREIGILRAVGWRAGRVIRMVLFEAVLLSIIGALCGTIGAIMVVQGLTRVPSVNGLIDGHIDPTLIAIGFLIAIGSGPARRPVPRPTRGPDDADRGAAARMRPSLKMELFRRCEKPVAPVEENLPDSAHRTLLPWSAEQFIKRLPASRPSFSWPRHSPIAQW